jgi:hypothetical protein
MDKGLIKYTVHFEKSPFTNDKEKQKAYQDIFCSDLGAKVLQDIMSDSGYFRSDIPNANNSDNGIQLAFNAGKKYVCRTILDMLTVKILEENVTADVMGYTLQEYSQEPEYGVISQQLL